MIGDSNPVFVKIDKYKEIMDIVEVINKKVFNVKRLLSELEELKGKEEEENGPEDNGPGRDRQVCERIRYARRSRKNLSL